MLRKSIRTALALAALAALVSGCGQGLLTGSAPGRLSTAAEKTGRFVVTFKSANSVPANLSQIVQAAGGTLVKAFPQIGEAIAASTNASFASTLAADGSVERVDADVSVQWIPGDESEALADETPQAPAPGSVTDPTTAALFALQWNMQQIQAPQAWAAGNLGSPNVRVAVLDTGIDYTHQDLAGKVDLAASKSFVPTDPVPAGAHEIADLHFHGTHVSGTIACNAIGTACVAPNVTLIGVKVLAANGSGTFEGVISGIVYAADLGVDVINMSLGARFAKNDPEALGLVAALNRAVNYASTKGVLVVSSAGNSAIDADHNGNEIIVPAQSGSGIAVSATGPLNGQNPDQLASYSNFGVSLVDVAAPGGNFSSTIRNARDFVLSPCSHFTLMPGLAACRVGQRYVFAAGTSMSAPHVSGVAALIDSKAGGGLTGSQLEARLQQTADDLGTGGTDPQYGKGRLNAFRATQ